VKCKECGIQMPNGLLKTCSDECREARRWARSTSVGTRWQMLWRILESETVPMSDRLYNPAAYESILIRGCAYCGMNLMNSTGICLDRIEGGNHTFENVVPCCGTCNRIKSDGPVKHDGFTFTEMLILGKAVAEVRRLRNSSGGNNDGRTVAS
jgi:hypothetical protein